MRLLRVIMLWWMVLALPMQGVAAAAMLHCGAAASGAPAYASSQQPAAAEHHGGMHAGADPAQHAHHAHPAMAMPDDAGTTDGLTPDEPLSGQPASHQAGPAAAHACSACAACCVAMGLPTGMPTLVAAPTAPTAVTALVAPAPSFLTAGPERPPRSQRA